jgi:hypothetical protein
MNGAFDRNNGDRIGADTCSFQSVKVADVGGLVVAGFRSLPICPLSSFVTFQTDRAMVVWTCERDKPKAMRVIHHTEGSKAGLWIFNDQGS